IFREGVYIKSTYLLCSIYQFTNYITNDIFIKILAFDNQRGLEYIIDLDYADLLEMTDGNVNLLNSQKDLSNYLTNSLAYFRNLEGDEFLVCEIRLYLADYTGQIISTESKLPTDASNKQLLSKHRKRDNLLHDDVGTVTDLEMNIIHEAFDTFFHHTV